MKKRWPLLLIVLLPLFLGPLWIRFLVPILVPTQPKNDYPLIAVAPPEIAFLRDLHPQSEIDHRPKAGSHTRGYRLMFLEKQRQAVLDAIGLHCPGTVPQSVPVEYGNYIFFDDKARRRDYRVIEARVAERHFGSPSGEFAVAVSRH